MAARCSDRRAAVGLALGLVLGGSVAAAETPGGEARLGRVRQEIRRLEEELRALGGRERGVLGEIDRLRAELQLREAEHERVTLELDALGAAIAQRGARLVAIDERQAGRSRYLAFRLRELYKDGPMRALRRLLGGTETESFLAALREASYLSERDARVLGEYRAESARLAAERASLADARAGLETLEAELRTARRRIEAARGERERLLADIRHDRTTRLSALGELARAATELERVVGSLEPAGTATALDVRKFRGLLEWPARGKVGAGFGSVVHPRFQTTLPHPGIDIEAAAGTDIVSVFDGRVVYAAWMRGYGLTTIVDHGGALLSVYAHAAALLVEPGQSVLQGQRLGQIGDTGSLRGPYLYFELREAGRPVDPRSWLRAR